MGKDMTNNEALFNNSAPPEVVESFKQIQKRVHKPPLGPRPTTEFLAHSPLASLSFEESMASYRDLLRQRGVSEVDMDRITKEQQENFAKDPTITLERLLELTRIHDELGSK